VAEPAPFEPCGGDPTGFWRLSDYDAGRFDLTLTGALGNVELTCPGQYPEPFRPTQTLLELKANGEAAFHTDFPSYRFQVIESCLNGVKANCSSLQRDFGCEATSCGVCECTGAADALTQEELTWSAEGNELRIVGERFGETVSFCVKDGKLSYRAEGGTNLATFERLYRTGEPQLCADRTPEDCTKGDNNSCVLGQCVGTGSCSEAGNAATCAKFQDCQWDASSCYGQVYVHCQLADFLAGTPGCALSEAPPTCKGTPWICEEQPGCAAKGCLFAAACTGGEQTCEYDDEDIEGCVCDLSCTGTLNCATIKDAATCNASGEDKGLQDACEWSTTACVATASPCEELTIDECETTIGCALQPQ
jgi:hypothetical protein